MSPEELDRLISELVDRHVRELLTEDRRLRRFESGEEREEVAFLHEDEAETRLEELAARKFTAVEELARDLLAKRGVHLEGEELEALLYELLRAHASALLNMRDERHRVLGDVMLPSPIEAQHARGTAAPHPADSVSLAAALAAFIRDRSPGWSPRHGQAVRTHLERLKDHLAAPCAVWPAGGADRPLATVSKADVIAFRDALRKRERWPRGGPRDEGEPAARSLGEKTIREHMVTAGSFFAYCLAAEWIDRSPAANLPGAPTRGRRVRPDEEREAVSDADLALILGGEAFRQLRDGVGAPSRASQPEREAAARELYWAMLLLVYTGARRGEVAQLWPSDIDEVDGVHCVSIAPSGEKGAEKAVKSRAGVRLIPLHADLLDLGLVHYVAEAKRSGRRRLFPWAAVREGERISKMWEMLREESGASRKATLHGLRHRFATQLKHAGVDEARIAQLVGHAHASLTTGRYGKRYDVQRLAEAMAAVRNRKALVSLFECGARLIPLR